MAQQNEILVGRFGQLANKLFGIKHANPAPQLAPEIMLVADLTEPPVENRYLMDERTAMGAVSVTGGAGKLAAAYLELPPQPGLNTIAIVERIVIVNNTGALFAVWLYYQPGPTVLLPAVGFGARAFIDPRIQGLPAALLDGSQDGAAIPTLGSRLATFAVPASNQILIDFPFVLARGSQLVLVCQTAAVNLQVMVQWRERSLSPGEQL